jgi:hypothetical protein
MMKTALAVLMVLLPGTAVAQNEIHIPDDMIVKDLKVEQSTKPLRREELFEQLKRRRDLFECPGAEDCPRLPTPSSEPHKNEK